MPLEPENERHAAQIQAGTIGRRRGHSFEAVLAEQVSKLPMPFRRQPLAEGCLFKGNPGLALLIFVLNSLKIDAVENAEGISAGALATAEAGGRELVVGGTQVRRCKSDVILVLRSRGKTITKGVSVKQCSNRNPTNAQLYFSTAVAFCELPRVSGYYVKSSNWLEAGGFSF
jgi:hypothetical protein